MSNITKTHKVGIFAIFIAAALIGSVVAFGDNMAFAGGKQKTQRFRTRNRAGQTNEQNGQCVTGTISLIRL